LESLRLADNEEGDVVLALFAFRVRPEVQAEFHESVRRMSELVHQVPGFISLDLFTSQDGRTLAVPRFESEEALLAWRNHPEHLAAQVNSSSLPPTSLALAYGPNPQPTSATPSLAANGESDPCAKPLPV